MGSSALLGPPHRKGRLTHFKRQSLREKWSRLQNRKPQRGCDYTLPSEPNLPIPFLRRHNDREVIEHPRYRSDMTRKALDRGAKKDVQIWEKRSHEHIWILNPLLPLRIWCACTLSVGMLCVSDRVTLFSQVGLELPMQPRLFSKVHRLSCLFFLWAGITGIFSHHTNFTSHFLHLCVSRRRGFIDCPEN